MDEIKLSFPVLKAVKKTTYNSINKQVNFKLNEDKIKKFIKRSNSYKKITNFVPNLKPKKSTFMPTPLILNADNKVLKEKDDFENKQLSEDENESFDDESSCSSLSSSDMNSSINEEDLDEEKNKGQTNEPLLKKYIIEKTPSKGIERNNDSFNLNEIKECVELEENENNEKNKNMKGLRKKMSQIKAKVDIVKFKEAKDIISNNFKNNFDFGSTKDEEVSYSGNLHFSRNIFEKKNSNFKPKSKSIFEVISLAKQNH